MAERLKTPSPTFCSLLTSRRRRLSFITRKSRGSNPRRLHQTIDCFTAVRDRRSGGRVVDAWASLRWCWLRLGSRARAACPGRWRPRPRPPRGQDGPNELRAGAPVHLPDVRPARSARHWNALRSAGVRLSLDSPAVGGADADRRGRLGPIHDQCPGDRSSTRVGAHCRRQSPRSGDRVTGPARWPFTSSGSHLGPAEVRALLASDVFPGLRKLTMFEGSLD